MENEHNLNVFRDYIKISTRILKGWSRILRGYDKIDISNYYDTLENGVKGEGKYFASAESKEQQIFFIDNILEKYDNVISEWKTDIRPKIEIEMQDKRYSDKNFYMNHGGRKLYGIIICISKRQQYWTKRKEKILIGDEKKELNKPLPPPKIEHLKYNVSTLPKSIYEYFRSLSNLLPPFTGSHIVSENGYEYNFFILEQNYEMFQLRISQGEITDEKGNILNRKTVHEFLVSYAKGFAKGYTDFINTISKTELFENSNKDLAYKIFERVHPTCFVKNGNITATKGKFFDNKPQCYITKELFYKTGYESGEYFNAWELILKSPMQFKEYFDKISVPKALQPPRTETKSEQITTIVKKTDTEIINTFCNSMPLDIAKNHFKVFTLPNAKNKNLPYLSTAQFNLFIEKAFTGKTELQKQTINHAPHKEKLFIVKRFYEFYLIATTNYENTSQCQEKYIKLLTDNFTNWNYESIKNNFGNKVKRDW